MTRAAERDATEVDDVAWWSSNGPTAALERAAELGHMPDAKRLASYTAARRRGTDWLLERMNPDGSLGDAADGFDYYRAAWTFGLVGEVEAAHAVCGFIRKNLLSADGRIDGPLRIIETDWAYRDSALIIGAQQIGEYDLSYGIFDELLRWQDPVSGGFSNDRLPDGSMSDLMDIPYACGPGFAALSVGRIDVARRVADFLRGFWDAQEIDAATGLPTNFYCFWSRSRQRPLRQEDDDFESYMVVENEADRFQRWTIGGISAGFLSRLYLADGDPAHLELARQFQAFSMAATEAQFAYPSVCKTSWGSSLLYLVTGEAAYRDWTMKLGDWYVAMQDDSGFWHPWQERREMDRIWITLEYVMHLDTLISGLSAHPSGTHA